MREIFKEYAANENNPKWENMIKREKPLYRRNNDMRNDFERDYTRVIHSTAYRRMKHKTQVFFSPKNDHICTRVEHITHVESISYTIAKYLGLNTELTRAIATAHDVGHSPFGHEGEKVLSKISQRDLGEKFWHEKNGLDMVDKIELLEDNLRNKQNLDLTYAVRDGIISHCGEIDENCLKPRDEAIDLKDYIKPNQYAPYTWEGCVVKVADKISYIGRDIEDAITLGILDEHLDDLYDLLSVNRNEVINNTVIINDLIYDLCKNSSVEKGLCFSDETFNRVNELKKFNYKYIYLNDRMAPGTEYFGVVLNRIYETLKSSYLNRNAVYKMYPSVMKEFEKWLECYWKKERKSIYKNEAMIDISDENEYCRAIIYYISGMTDNFAIKTYEKIIGF